MSQLNQNDLKALLEVIRLLPMVTTFAKTDTSKRHFEDVKLRLEKILNILNRAITAKPKTPLFEILEDSLVDKVLLGVKHG